jgi:uncharacterized phage protein (TIGR02216 family)
MQWGLGPLGLAPETFWAMTPKELEAALHWRLAGMAAAPLDRAGLDDLMTRYPDGERNA